MTLRTRTHLLFLAAAIALAACLSGAQQHAATVTAQAQAAAQALSEPMPLDPQITMGKFPNGMRYYIRNNKKPEKRAELRLVVKAGSILEDDDQQGLAHLVEHMAFNGTSHFPKNELVSFIESLGMRFGADVNAYTSFDETAYMLTVPTDKPETIDKGLLVLEDWAHNLSFDPVEIDKERGVVMEEWRLGRGAGARMRDKLFPVLLKGSRYADRLPIGKPEIIQNGKQERLKQFYADWYRPDLMAVVAVGDFDKAAIEKMITTHFASIPAAAKPRPRTYYDVPDHSGTAYAIATDKEANTTAVEIDTLLPGREQGSVGVYRQKTVDALFSGMLSARFSELAQKADAPFIGAGAFRGSFFARSKDSATLGALVKEDGIERGLDALLSEAERVARFGFTATELDRQKQSVLRSYERNALEKENRLSGSRADEYVRNFLENESLPTADDSAVLLESTPTPGTITKTTTKDAIGITEWELSNGVRVILKPTTFKEDEILFRAISPGGTSLASDKDYIPASSATQVINASGVGKFSAIDLRKFMTGKVASATPYISEVEEGLNGSSSRKDLETMFQLIYLRFTQPRADATAFAVQTAQTKTFLANQTAIPEFVFFNALNTTRYQNHLRRRLSTPATVDEWNLDKSLAFYKDRFADASDFTFVFVGSFEPATIKPLVERYLGSLPSIRRKESWKDVGVRCKPGYWRRFAKSWEAPMGSPQFPAMSGSPIRLTPLLFGLEAPLTAPRI